MLVQFPFQKRKAAGPQGTPSKESTGRFGVSSDKEDDSVVTVSDNGSDPNGASNSTGRTAPQQEQSLLAETTEAVLIATRMSCTARTIRLSKRYGPAFSGWTLT